MNFNKVLIEWYLRNRRDLPWRETRDPYKVWLSEIMLQQTRVEQGLPYYLKFINAFPDVFALANAGEEKILKLWQGLGYYSRARNMHKTAGFIAGECRGVFPSSYKELLKLKGVGDYTASAIAAFCYREPVAVLDGNVYRLLSRYFGVETPINTTEGKKEFSALAKEVLDRGMPDVYNQAIMEFGALQCRPQRPLCESCPLSDSCAALQKKMTDMLPVKLKKGRIRKRYFNYLVFISEENKTLLEKLQGKGIWEGLYQFPLVETESAVTVQDLQKQAGYSGLTEEHQAEPMLLNDEPVIHKLSHQHIHTRFWLVKKEELSEEAVSVRELHKYPVPVLIANFLNEYNFSGY